MNQSLDIQLALCARARAQRQWPEIGFSDQSASLLAQLLGINVKQRLSPLDERRLIQRNQWFDECCRDFFQRHPHAMCIELGAGLSTRFHRLSDTADWPRFNWVEVDLPQVSALKADVLPAIDNYRLVGADIEQDDWIGLIGWTSGPVLILLEAVAQELKGDSLLKLIYQLRQRLGAVELEIVLDDQRPHLWQPWFKTFASYFGISYRVPIAAELPALEAQGFRLTRKENLLGNTVLGIVINYCEQDVL